MPRDMCVGSAASLHGSNLAEFVTTQVPLLAPI